MENIELSKEAVLVKRIKEDKQESILPSGLILASETKKDTYYEVVAIGSEVTNIKLGEILRVKESYGEELEINFNSYLYFPHAESCYYYKKQV